MKFKNLKPAKQKKLLKKLKERKVIYFKLMRNEL